MDIAQIIAHALHDASPQVVTNVPGYGGTQVFEVYSDLSSKPCPPSFHEEVAYSVAHGASLAGKRSTTLLKAHGLAKAANSVVDSLTAGVNAGFVVLVFDDKQGKHSDSIFDAPALLQGLAIPYRIPKISDIYREVTEAFLRSYDSQLPVALLIDTEDLSQEGIYSSGPLDFPPRPFRRMVAQHVLCPLLAEYQHQVLSAKLAFKNWRSFTPPLLPDTPDSLPPEWRGFALMYKPFFDAFRDLRGDIVVGDTGISSAFSFPPYHCVDICTYMGGSIPLALGAHLAGYQDVWAVTGDFSFIAAGYLGLIEAVQRQAPLKVVILYNHKAQTTGGQPIPAGLMETILKGHESALLTIEDPTSGAEVAEILKAAKQATDMRIVLVDYEK
jgi:TPP-dependent indolepyruvate ferredoxin oxidoreductase alpha subunit